MNGILAWIMASILFSGIVIMGVGGLMLVTYEGNLQENSEDFSDTQ